MVVESILPHQTKMILVSFFSADNVLSDEIKMCIFLNIKITKIKHSVFFFGTPGILFTWLIFFIGNVICHNGTYQICMEEV